MKKIKMKTIMAGPDLSANIGDVITVEDKQADELINSSSAELVEVVKDEVKGEHEEIKPDETESEDKDNKVENVTESEEIQTKDDGKETESIENVTESEEKEVIKSKKNRR